MEKIDRADDKPPYRQIASILREGIVSNQLPARKRLPSEAELIEHFGVARMTVRQAIYELRSEGLVISQHGRGVFVRPTPLASTRDPVLTAGCVNSGEAIA